MLLFHFHPADCGLPGEWAPWSHELLVFPPPEEFHQSDQHSIVLLADEHLAWAPDGKDLTGPYRDPEGEIRLDFSVQLLVREQQLLKALKKVHSWNLLPWKSAMHSPQSRKQLIS